MIDFVCVCVCGISPQQILALKTAIIELRQTLQDMVSADKATEIRLLPSTIDDKIILFVCVCVHMKDPESVEAKSIQSNLLQYARDLRSVRKQRKNEMASEHALLKLILK